MRVLSTGFLLASLLIGCATGEPPSSGDQDMSPPKDMPKDTQQDMSPPKDMKPDIKDEEMGPPRVCEPGITGCTDDGQLVTCKADGSGYNMTNCPEREVCEEGACVRPRVCEDGFSECEGPTTRRYCRPGGFDFASEECGQDLSCIKGACVSGATNGATCTSNADCASGLCHCGDDEDCAAGITPGYCTIKCDDANPCADSEWCMAGDSHNLGNAQLHYDHCVPRCGNSCANTDFTCTDVPTRGNPDNLSWKKACYFKQPIPIGGECTEDAQCISGTCLKGYFNTGYCTRRCETGGCPNGSACVELKPGEQWCSLLCGTGQGNDGVCPLDVPTDRNDVKCSLMQVFNGGIRRVCRRT